MSHHYIDFKNVRYSYPNGHEALKGVSFRVTHGEKVALLGLNGAGKSTLLLTTNGLLLPSSGEVNVGGIPVTKKTAPGVRRSVGMLFQNADDQLFMPTVEEDVAFGPLNMGLPADEVRRRVREAMVRTGVSGVGERTPFQLSGGQKQRVAIARGLCMEPEILLFDEPTSALDPEMVQGVLTVMKDLAKSGLTMIIVTHEMAFARDVASRIIFMDQGYVAEDTDPESFFTTPATERAREFLSRYREQQS